MVSTGEHDAATGGSATSQAGWLDERTWQSHRAVGWGMRALMVAIPLGVSWLAVWGLSRAFPRPDHTLVFVIWLLGLCATAIAVAVLVERQTRRLAPVSFLYQLTLAFPDKAPPRFRTALRSMSGRELERALEGGTTETDMLTPQEAAEQVLVLVASLSRHDRLTRGHSERVRAFSEMLGEQLGLAPAELAKLQWAALIHDIGKLHVPPEILNKPGRPEPEEWEVIRAHPASASVYVESLRPWLGDWVDAATQHHERYDGGGYPDGLSGAEISLAGRLVAVADAYDVMTAARSYKPALPVEQARAELAKNAGTQFDPVMVKAFLEVSLPRVRGTVGPLGFVAHLPALLQAPAAAVASSATTAVTTFAAAAGATGLAIAPAPQPVEAPPADLAFVLPTEIDEATTFALADFEFPSATPPADTEIGSPVDPTVPEPEPPRTPAPTPAPTPSPSPDPAPQPEPGPSPAPRRDPTPGPTPTPPSPTPGPQPTPTPTPPPSPSPTPTPTPTPSPTPTPTPNPDPTAHPDEATVAPGAWVLLKVLDNDSFPLVDPDPRTLEIAEPPHHAASLTIVGRNVRYTAGEVEAVDTFTYRICDFDDRCVTAVVTVTITSG